MENITMSIDTSKINTRIAKNMSLFISKNELMQSLNKNTCLSVFNFDKYTIEKSNNSNKLFNINLLEFNKNNLDKEIKLPTCSICMQNLEDGDIIRTTICNHIFHHKRFEFKLSCPNCRKIII